MPDNGPEASPRILAATERLLIQTGDEHAVSIRAVADAVGVTPPSIYLHFADKDELIQQVCQRQFRALDDRMRAAAARHPDDPLEALCQRGNAYVRFGLENPEQYRILFMAADKGQAQDADVVYQSAALAQMVEAVRECMDAGLLRRTDPRLVTVALWATAHGITALMIAKPGFPWPDKLWLADRLLRSHVAGLATPEVAATHPSLADVLTTPPPDVGGQVAAGPADGNGHGRAPGDPTAGGDDAEGR